jgi:hypothetical protein
LPSEPTAIPDALENFVIDHADTHNLMTPAGFSQSA